MANAKDLDVSDATDSMLDIGMVLRALEKLGQTFHGDVNRVINRLDVMERNLVLLIGRISDIETVQIQFMARLAKCESRIADLETLNGPRPLFKERP